MLDRMHAPVLEINEIQHFLQHISFNTHVILDLDNTVMEPLGMIAGSDQWFTQVCNRALQMKEPMLSVINIYHAVQHQLKMQPVEDKVIKLIKYLQSIGIPVLALTARGQTLKETTIRQLQEIGINFHDIIFCDGGHKGDCLATYYGDELPSHILIVDDKEKHALHVKTKMETRGVRVSALRYGFLDDKVAAVDMEIAKNELTNMRDTFLPSTQLIMAKLGVITGDINDATIHHMNPASPIVITQHKASPLPDSLENSCNTSISQHSVSTRNPGFN